VVPGARGVVLPLAATLALAAGTLLPHPPARADGGNPPAPAPQAQHPIVDGVHPLAEGVHPFPEGVHPIHEGVHPIANGVHPLVDGVHPLVDGVHPLVDGVHPLVDGVHPLVDGVHPLVDGVHPIVDGVHPLTDGVHPLVDGVHQSKDGEAGAGEVVIPPGQEAVVGAMLGGGALPGGCRFLGASLDRDRVVARYGCGGAPPIEIQLRHPGDRAAPATAPRTRSFVLVAPPGAPADLVEAVRRGIEAHEGGWRWSEPARTALLPAVAATLPTLDPSAHLPGGVADRLEAGVRLYRAGRYREAVEALLDPVRRDPRGGGIPLLVAALLATPPGAAAAKARTAEADGHVDDPVAQLAAGLGLLQRARLAAASPEARARLFAAADRYLDRTDPALAGEPAVLMERALAHAALGARDEAHRLLVRYRSLPAESPDVFLVAAMIDSSWQQRAAMELGSYFPAVEAARRRGETVNEARVALARRALDRLRAGEPVLFPITPAPEALDDRPEPLSPGTRAVRLLEGAAVLALLGRLALLGWFHRRRARVAPG